MVTCAKTGECHVVDDAFTYAQPNEQWKGAQAVASNVAVFHGFELRTTEFKKLVADHNFASLNIWYKIVYILVQLLCVCVPRRRNLVTLIRTRKSFQNVGQYWVKEYNPWNSSLRWLQSMRCKAENNMEIKRLHIIFMYLGMTTQSFAEIIFDVKARIMFKWCIYLIRGPQNRKNLTGWISSLEE